MRAPRSLRARITIAAVAAVALAGIPAAVFLVAAIEHDARAAVDATLAQRVQEIGQQPFGHDHGGPDEHDRLLVGTGSFVQVADGAQVVDRQGDVPDEPPPVPAGDGLSTVTIDGDHWRALTSTTGDTRVEVLTTLAPVEARVASTRRLVAAIGLVALLITGVAAWAFASLTLRPLARLRAGAARIGGADDLRAPLPADDGPDEIRALAGTLNDMLARLQAAMQATRRFAADAGHELRTPLAGMRANLDALARNPGLPAEQRAALVTDTTGELERAVHVLEGLQALARGEAAESLPREDVELDEVIDAAVYAARRRHPATRYTLDEPFAAARVRGWGDGLRLLVDNLLDNAALHGGGEVHVGLARHNGHVLLRVEDDGPGVRAGDRDRVLEPFVRAAAGGAPGTGLGLTIVSQQAVLHGGAVALGESRRGGLAGEARLSVS